MCLLASCSHSSAIASATDRTRPLGRCGYRTSSRWLSGDPTSCCKLLLRDGHICLLLDGALHSTHRSGRGGKCHSDSAIENRCSLIQRNLTRPSWQEYSYSLMRVSPKCFKLLDMSTQLNYDDAVTVARSGDALDLPHRLANVLARTM